MTAILCLTPNPAIDRVLTLPDFQVGAVMRAQTVSAAAGGKGLNVARVIQSLGGIAACGGFLAGYTGKWFAELAEHEGIDGSWTWIDGETRTCLILAIDGAADTTLINEPGPMTTVADWERLADEALQLSRPETTVSLSGSLPGGEALDGFVRLLQRLQAAERMIWLDTSGAALRAALQIPGVNLKVNAYEVAEALGRPIQNREQAADAARQLQERLGGSVMLTLGAAGALIREQGQTWFAESPKVAAINTVGSGDSALGGLLLAREHGLTPPDVLRWAIAAGAANALSLGVGQVDHTTWNALREQIIVTQL